MKTALSIARKLYFITSNINETVNNDIDFELAKDITLFYRYGYYPELFYKSVNPICCFEKNRYIIRNKQLFNKIFNDKELTEKIYLFIEEKLLEIL
jgi:hypothetical protein